MADIFNTYFSDNMANLTSPTNSLVRTQLNNFSVEQQTCFVVTFYQIQHLYWQFRTNSDDASYVRSEQTQFVDTSLDENDAIVDNGGNGAQTRVSGDISLNADQYYPFAVVVGNNTGPGILTLEWRVNNGNQSNGVGFVL